ncbi:hypothetical protein [Enterobacter asburiae]|uniref:hypothetical protein n=2 Tax=Enterobacterales TaxID=91347 RepID=UPI0020033345|nr:hypothetical protein [Enterobacter asburiae]MCK6657906.1 hypothetical protein [Enterobacter asburiae]
MMYVYRRPPNQLLSISRLKQYLLHEVESNQHIMRQWESARAALRNIRHKGHDADTASWVSLKNDPRVFTNGADEKHGLIFVDDDDQSALVVASWLIDEYGSPLATY